MLRDSHSGYQYDDIDTTLLPKSICWIVVKSSDGLDFAINMKTNVMPSFFSQEASRRGEIVTSGFNTGFTELLQICETGDVDDLRSFLESVSKPYIGIQARDAFCNTALHLAARRNYFADVRVIMLLNAGAEFNCQAFHNTTPLHMAAACGNIDAIKVLLKAGADRTLQEVDGNMATDGAIRCGHAAIVSVLLEGLSHDKKPQGNASIYMASKLGHEAVLEALFCGPRTETRVKDLTTRINTRISTGDTSLCIATEDGNVDVVKLLLRYGAQNIIRQYTQGTAIMIHAACHNGSLAVIRLFDQHGFNLSSGAEDTADRRFG